MSPLNPYIKNLVLRLAPLGHDETFRRWEHLFFGLLEACGTHKKKRQWDPSYFLFLSFALWPRRSVFFSQMFVPCAAIAPKQQGKLTMD
jgi:hypothetical protein